MNRQQAFEAIYAKQHDVPAESLVQYRHKSKEGYSLPGIASHYGTYCMALDSIVVTLPKSIDAYGCHGHHSSDPDEALILEDVHAALTAAGVKYK